MTAVRVSLALLLLLWTVLGPATPAPAARWIEVQTQNFRFLSAQSEADTLQLAREFETFRGLILAVTNASTSAHERPVEVYLFKTVGDFSRYRPSPTAGGYFDATQRGSLMALGPFDEDFMRQALYHEYIHFLVHNHTSIPYPVWYDEGLAEYFGNVTLKGDRLMVGGAQTHQLDWLARGRKMAWGSILKRTDYRGLGRRNMGMFYAQSWALVHYLQNRESETPFRQELTRYLALRSEGTSVEDAFVQAFGISIGRLDRSIDNYFRRGSLPGFSVKADSFLAAFESTTRSLEELEIDPLLGWLAVRYGNAGQAEKLFERTLKSRPGDVRALLGMARLAAEDGDLEAATALQKQALEHGPEDPWAHLERARLVMSQAREEEDGAKRKQLLSEARRHYARVSRLAPELPESFAGYGESFLLPGEESERGLESLEHAHRLLRSDLGTQLALAELYMKLDRDDDARALIQNVLAWRHGKAHEERAEELLEELASSSD